MVLPGKKRGKEKNDDGSTRQKKKKKKKNGSTRHKCPLQHFQFEVDFQCPRSLCHPCHCHYHYGIHQKYYDNNSEDDDDDDDDDDDGNLYTSLAKTVLAGKSNSLPGWKGTFAPGTRETSLKNRNVKKYF